jgi:hypothetical protein
LFSPSEPELGPGVRIEPDSVVEGHEAAGGGDVTGIGDPVLGIGGRIGGVTARVATGFVAARFPEPAALGVVVVFVILCGFVYFTAVFFFAHALILFTMPVRPFPFFRARAFFIILFVFFFVFFAFLAMIALPIVATPPSSPFDQ